MMVNQRGMPRNLQYSPVGKILKCPTQVLLFKFVVYRIAIATDFDPPYIKVCCKIGDSLLKKLS